MQKTMDEILASNLPVRVRSNHALEHATLHVLQQKGLKTQLGGISDIGGFWIYGEVESDILLEAAKEGLKRLIAGEKELAIHPNCGTNIAVGGLAAGGMAWLSMLGARRNARKFLRRLPAAVVLGVVGYKLARPYGPKLQERITTNADVSGLEIVEVVKHDVMGHTVHRVATRLR